MIEFRPMKKEDAKQVAELERLYFSRPWSEQALLDAMGKKEYFYMVAEEEGVIAGYCGLYQVLDEGSITQVAVREDVRRKGIAKQLLQDFMQKGEQRGIAAYTLEVRVSNLAAVSLYEGCGFVKECVRKDFYSLPKEDAYIMWKR